MGDFFAMPIKAKPYFHQQMAFDFACNKFGITTPNITSNGVALLMERGCGKSLTGIGIAGALFQFGRIRRAFIMCPLSIVGVWQQEFERFADFPYELTILKDSSAKKKEMLSVIPDTGLQVVVVNYESAWRIQDALEEFGAELIIADEGHKIIEARTATG